ncbi:MAG: AAA family ATPase [Desulfosarcinaceae bacterium]|nr:AAA family ATPase [Desulfosarcinaceae bacterium]
MYLAHYRLTRKPFEAKPDPAFFWGGDPFKEALAMMEYTIVEGKGFMSLTGDGGSGKTLLIQALAERIKDSAILAHAATPKLEKLGFFRMTAELLGLDLNFNTKGEFIHRLKNFMLDAHRNQQEVVLVIDQAHLLDAALLEEIRHFSNIERPDKKLITIILVGRRALWQKVQQNIALRQRIAFNHTLPPLKKRDIAAYIDHRLHIAGGGRQLFTRTAIDAVYTLSGGNPLTINSICDAALAIGCAEGAECIGQDIIDRTTPEAALPPSVDPPPRRATGRWAHLAVAASVTIILAAGYLWIGGRNRQIPLETEDPWRQAVAMMTEPSPTKTSDRAPALAVDTSLEAVAKLQMRIAQLEKQLAMAEHERRELEAVNAKQLAEIEAQRSAQERLLGLEQSLTEAQQRHLMRQQEMDDLVIRLKQVQAENRRLQVELDTQAAIIAESRAWREAIQALGTNPVEAGKPGALPRRAPVPEAVEPGLEVELPLPTLSPPPDVPTLPAETVKISGTTETAEQPSPDELIDWILKKQSE